MAGHQMMNGKEPLPYGRLRQANRGRDVANFCRKKPLEMRAKGIFIQLNDC